LYLARALLLTLTRPLSLSCLHDCRLALRGYVVLVLSETVDDAATAGLNIRAELLHIGLARGPQLIQNR